MLAQLWLVLLFPVLGFLVLVFAGSCLSKRTIASIGIGSVGCSALLVALIGNTYLTGDLAPYRLMLGYWVNLEQLQVPVALYLDALSLTMLFVVTGVGLLIHVYAAGFMVNDADYARFFAYMNLFVFAMLVLVLADNLLLLYLGWEGVGLCSYLLIGFWYKQPENGTAAQKAFLMTRLGDAAMILGLCLIYNQLHVLDIQAAMLAAKLHWPSGTYLPVAAAALLLGGALGKSAQLPLQTWLPDAMAGPTPVSALIHAATMVTAGVYLIARTHVLFNLAPVVQYAIALIGTATLLFAGCCALVQTDIKRILAYSTISQIGYMFLALGVGAWSAAINHLMSHAFFKALLFLAAGGVMYCFHDEHNIFKMGGLRKVMPLVFGCFAIGSAALAGLPFTSGYYSKHEILVASFAVSPGLWVMGCFGALITGIYSFRLLFVVFFGHQANLIQNKINVYMALPLVLLSILALAGGLLHLPLHSVLPAIQQSNALNDFVDGLSIAAPMLGLLIAMLVYLTNTITSERLLVRNIHQLWLNGWGFDWLYDRLFVGPYNFLTKLNKQDVFDKAITEIALLCGRLHHIVSLAQTGNVRWYATVMGMGVVVLIALGLWL